MTPSYEDLQEQVAYLKDMLAELRGDLPQHARLRSEFGLTPKQAATLALLLNGERVSVDAIYSNVFEHHNGGGPDTPIIRVVVSQLRRKLSLFQAPGTILAYYGMGIYELSSELRAWIQQRLEPLQVAA